MLGRNLKKSCCLVEKVINLDKEAVNNLTEAN